MRYTLQSNACMQRASRRLESGIVGRLSPPWREILPHSKRIINCRILDRTQMEARQSYCHDWGTYGFALSAAQACEQEDWCWIHASRSRDVRRRNLAHLVRQRSQYCWEGDGERWKRQLC